MNPILEYLMSREKAKEVKRDIRVRNKRILEILEVEDFYELSGNSWIATKFKQRKTDIELNFKTWGSEYLGISCNGQSLCYKFGIPFLTLNNKTNYQGVGQTEHLDEVLAFRGQPPLRFEELFKIREEDLQSIASRYKLNYNREIFHPTACSSGDFLFYDNGSINSFEAYESVRRFLGAWAEFRESVK